MNKCRKNNNRFKKLALKKEREKRKTAQNCKSPTKKQKSITTMKSVTEYTQTHVYL